MFNGEISKLRFGETILHFYAWRKSQAAQRREKQLESDEIEVFDYTSHEFSQDTNSELKFKGE